MSASCHRLRPLTHHPRVAAPCLAWCTALAVTTALLTAAPTQAQTRPATAQRNLVPVALELPGGERAALFDASYALVIGASNYRNGWSSLPGVADDVKAVGALLQRNGFEVSTVMDPTRDQLDQALGQFAGRYGAREGNRLLIYFAGHGHTRTSGVSKVGYIVPVDAPDPRKDPGGFITKAYSMGRLEAVAKEIQSRHALFVFDSCFSGTIFRARSVVPDAISDRTARPVRQFITAGDEDQTVPDHSHFRRALERGLGTDAEADLNGDRYITGSELGEYLYDQVTNYTRKAQTPRHGKIQDPALDRGDFVFLSLRQPNPPPPPPVVDTELQRWTAALQANTEAAYTDFLRTHPQGAYASAARNALNALKPPAPAPSPAPTPTQVAQQAPALGLRAGQVVKDCAECPELVVIPAGEFTMGSPSNEPERLDREGPQRSVRVASFLAGKTEVTFAQWGACVAAGGCSHKPSDEGWGQRPVINVSWDDAQQYVQWLSRKMGQGYRLLSEAEWEYVARAGTSTPFWTGATITTTQANFYGNGSSNGEYRQETVPVGSFGANAFGLHDTAGNVWEWVQDVWHDNYSGAPSDGSAWVSGGDQSQRVLRGGSWVGGPEVLRSANRSRSTPGIRYNNAGFRIARTY